MAGTPPEYSLRYRWTGRSNQKMTGERGIGKNNFTITGNEAAVGKVNKIVIKHFHSEVYQRGHSYTVTFNWSGGKATSDSVYKMFTQNWTITNTITAGLPTAEQFATWSSITIIPTGNLANHYWRATSDNPIDVIVYYYDKKDMVDGAAPPTVTGVSHADDSGLLGTFGNYVQNYSDAVITGQYTIDNVNFPYLSAQHILTLADSNGDQLYTASQKDNAVFSVGRIAASGAVSWTYTVTDTAGNSVSKEGTFAVLPYAEPSVVQRAAGVDIGQRYASSVDDTGQPIYLAAADGDHVWFDLSAKVTAITGKNAWTLSLAYGQGDPTEDAGKQIASGTDGASGAVKTYANDRSLVTEVISPANDYWFRFTVADKVSSASLIVYVDKATSLFDVEPDGVAVGMYSTATAEHKMFQVAETHESQLLGGIMGVTNYEEGEVLTGGHWIDGKPIYRLIKNVTVTSASFGANSGNYTGVKFFTEIPENIVFSHVDVIRNDGGIVSGGTILPYQSAWNYSIDYYFHGDGFTFVRGARTSQSAATYQLRVMVWYTKPDTPVSSSDPGLPEGPEIFDDGPYADEGVARADYIAMMAGIEIPTDAEATGDVQADAGGMELPGIEEEPQHSAKYELVKLYRDAGVWSAAMVRNAAGKWITADEAEEILNDQEGGPNGAD